MILTKTKLQKIIYEELEYAILERNVIKEELRHVLTEKKKKKKKKSAAEKKFQKSVIEASNTKTIIVNITMKNSCPPCKALKPSLIKATTDLGVTLIDIDMEQDTGADLVEKLKLKPVDAGTPYILAYRNGKSTWWDHSDFPWTKLRPLKKLEYHGSSKSGKTWKHFNPGTDAWKKEFAGPENEMVNEIKTWITGITGKGEAVGDTGGKGKEKKDGDGLSIQKARPILAANPNVKFEKGEIIPKEGYKWANEGVDDNYEVVKEKDEGKKAEVPKKDVEAAKASALRTAGVGLGAPDGGVMKDAIMASKKGDKLKLNFQKDVDHMGVAVFKKGTEYKGIVQGQKGNKVSVDHEKIIFVGSNTTMTKAEFIEKLASQDGEPCEILNCGSSTITRGSESKSFVEYLADPTFGEKPEAAAAKAEPAKAEPAKAEPAKAQGTHEVFDTYKDPKGETYLALRTLPNPKSGQTIARLEDDTTLIVEKKGVGSTGKWAKIKVTSGKHVNQTGYVHTNWIRKLTTGAKTADIAPGGDTAPKTGAPVTPETLLTFMAPDGKKPLGVKEVFSKLKELGVPSLKGRWHLQPLEDGKCTDAENCTKDGRMKRNHPIRVNFREWWKATAKWRKKKAVAKKKAPEIKPMDSFPEGGLASQGFKGEIEKGTESVVSNETNQELVQKVKDLDSQLKTVAITINNSAHDPKLNKNARKMLDKLKKAKNKAVKAANTQAGLGDAYKGVKRKKKSSKLTKAQKRFSNSTINARRAAYKKAEAKRIEAERIKAYQKTKTPRADSKPPAR